MRSCTCQACRATPSGLAEYNDTPSFTYDFDLWQYASDGSVDGIDGDVDLNLAFIGK